MKFENIKRIFILIICIYIQYDKLYCEINSSNFGFRFGIAFDIGNLINRIGVTFDFFVYYDFIQLNFINKVYYIITDYTTNKNFIELQNGIGIVFSFLDEKLYNTNYFFSLNINNTKRKYSIGYSYKYYLNSINTSQSTGTLSFEYDNIYLLFDNDLFSFAETDKYRTGALGLFYYYNNFQFGVKSVLWTGLAKEAPTIEDNNYPSRFHRYKDMLNMPYGNTSHGILCMQIQYLFMYSQTFQFNLGIDSEYVRHYIQNKWIHDMYFIPEEWIDYKNPHVPMIDKNGGLYLFKDGQEVKPAVLYLNIGINSENFY